jgi:hypothetical protein
VGRRKTAKTAEVGSEKDWRSINDLAVFDHESIAHRELEGLGAKRADALGSMNTMSLNTADRSGTAPRSGKRANVVSSVCIPEHGLRKGGLLVDERPEEAKELAGFGQRAAFGEHRRKVLRPHERSENP